YLRANGGVCAIERHHAASEPAAVTAGRNFSGPAPNRAQYTSRVRQYTVPLFICLLSIGLFAESAAGLRWTAPAGWKVEGAQPMRAATYTVAPAPGDKARAECGVYFFGAGQ